MISAFGVVHEIEKGLPSALRNNGAGLGTDYMTRASGYRIMAHNQGRDQAKRIATKGRIISIEPGTPSPTGLRDRNRSRKSLKYLARTGQRSRTPSGVKKSYLPGTGYKPMKNLSAIERRGLRMDLERKRKQAATVDQPIPGMFKPKKTPISSHAATVARKEISRAKRERQGLKVSPVKRKV